MVSLLKRALPPHTRQRQYDRNGATTRSNTNETISNENRDVARNENRSEERTSAYKHDMNVDRDVAACLLPKNKAEVELGEIAADHAHDKDVKDFAEKMVKDHKEVIEKLERLVGSSEPNDRRSE
jgi:uncharacterized protein (DUF305 family)